MEIIINGQSIAVEQEILDKAIEDGKLEVSNEEFVLFKKEDYEKRQKNLADSEYKKGKIAGVEIIAKDIKEKQGIEIEGKDFDAIFDAFKTNILKDAKIKPDAKIQELTGDLEKTRANLIKLEKEKEDIKLDYDNKAKRSKIDASLYAMIPESAVTKQLNRTDLIALYKASGFDADISEDGKLITIENGQVLKDKVTLEPIEVKDSFVKFIESKVTIENTDEPKDRMPTGATSLEKFYKEMEGKSSEETNREMQKRIAAKTLVL